MPNQSVHSLDAALHALADPTRRAVVERLGRGAVATSELTDPFAMALPSFLQHLRVLEAAGLVTSTKEGRVRTYRLRAEPLDAVEGWLAGQKRVWTRRLDQLDDHLMSRQHTIRTTTKEHP